MRCKLITAVSQALLVWLFPVAASAQLELPEQAKPWFLVIMDTSGSMNDPPEMENSCGFTSNKMGAAKCALRDILDSTGDADFGLVQFLHPCRDACDDQSGATDGCPNDTECGAQLLEPIVPDNHPMVREWVDGQCQGTCSGGYTRELYSRGCTPLGASLRLVRDYMEGNASGVAAPTAEDDFAARQCRKVSVILLTDGDETCDGDPTARAQELHAVAAPIPGGTTIDLDVRTYVIGFGIDPGDEDVEAISEGGCTCAGTYAADSCTADQDPATPCDPCGGECTGNRGFYAQDEQELSAAFNQIIADAQLAPEICNNEDDNCNGLIDEGIVKYCDRPNGIDDLVLCEPPEETECDGIDDNCDGRIDEGLLNDCGFCGDVPEEVCDGLDNDCDGATDEGVEEGGECGVDEGICQTGTLRCIDGEYECVNERGPGQEQCNCLDDDCDGETDEDPEGNLCPPGYVCFQCECVPLCSPGEEFGKCDPGLIPMEDDSGRCICVEDPCNQLTCARLTREADGEVICGPNRADVAACACILGVCLAPCEAVECEEGRVCDPKTGNCISDHCSAAGCDDGERCDAVSGQCEPDPCATAQCDEDEVCRDGDCESSCATVQCEDGEQCRSGRCVQDKCAGVLCQRNESCDPDSGECVADACTGQRCEVGLRCDPVSGDCVPLACAVVHCPEGQDCRDGECFFTPGTDPDDGDDDGDKSDALEPRYISAAGSGCGCSVPGAQRARHNWGLSVLLGFGLLLLWTTVRSRGKGRRRTALRYRIGFRRRAALRGSVHGWLTVLSALLAAAIWAALSSGCDGARAGLCIANCPDAAQPGGWDAAMDAGRRHPDASSGEGGQPHKDAAADGAAEAGAECDDDGGVEDEICNGIDDDCDGRTDEDLTPPNGFCGRAGVCEDVVAECSSEGAWVCDFPDAYEFDETQCDGLDNDCDGDTDEGFPGLGTECSVGIGACRGQGEITCDSSGTGTECSVTQPEDPQDEICDGLDNDCDGDVDEPKSAPGSHANYVVEDMVQIDTDLWIYAYEASRPDATQESQGTVSERSCSRSNVLPWTNLTYPEARAACEAAGLRLCTADEWQQACQGSGTAETCNWSYTPTETTTCNDYIDDGSDACNGKEFEDASLGPGRWLLPTGHLPECYADHGADKRIYDMSGNVKEWAEGSTAGVNPLRGGSMNNVAEGLRCDFDFAAANDTFKFQNVGFRCCSSEAP